MNILILGGGGFIGSHTAKRLKEEGNTVVCVDLKKSEYWQEDKICDQFIIGDLRVPQFVDALMQGYYDEPWDWVMQYAADMGGASYIFTGEHDADIMHNSATINLNVAYSAVTHKVGRVFYSSSACAYPGYRQEDPECIECCKEDNIYPAMPDSEYGWEKLFSERLYKAYERNYGLNVRIARYHNIFGPMGSWTGGKEKAPAAICRKVAETKEICEVTKVENGEIERRIEEKGYRSNTTPIYNNIIDEQNSSLNIIDGEHIDEYQNYIDIWGDGQQTRSFLYIDECVEGTIRLMGSECKEIVNIGSEEMISINALARMVIGISGKNLVINNIDGPTGVRGRNSHNQLIANALGWSPTQPLRTGMELLYSWIEQQVKDQQ